ncbi:isopentenyl-diphosphate delta-isomerase [Philodulcilactobacillus myokoensis]|uniref:Isopentenyl-diphosphate delta-isomerase n=1 Tax=Philodulcilactobacillus myokoensis TaxID=2929573 RepID=A0A9W6ESU6_9LACO|nr:type 2 isopentenyl-diphosphate Delta-isomerase [Philodulcilactobacillus myokoensis]GLB46837.1 isopentenyl-diphosphate delta-isomerase [Philodulcilactobacillus myokoensis]
MTSKHSQRKNEHVSLAEKFYSTPKNADFNRVKFIHQSLPEINLSDIDYSTYLGHLKLKCPFYIEAMTGGSEQTKKLNARLAQIANATGIAMACGSQSIALADSSLIDTFSIIRHYDKNGVVIANMSASHSLDDAIKVVKMINANALEIHINAPQELIMPEGDRSFYWLDQIKAINDHFNLPIIIKEVGYGMAKETIQKLLDAGIKIVNVSGRGGTNFAKIENFRRPDQDLFYLNDWGQTTVQSLLEAQSVHRHPEIIASGGIQTPLDIAKALCLGANAVGIAGEMLHLLIHNSNDEIIKIIKQWQAGLKIIMTMLGCRNIYDLQQQKLLLDEKLLNYIKQRHIKY